MKIWNQQKQPVEVDPVETAQKFWQSEYGRVAGEKCYPIDTMLERYLAAEHGAVVWNTRDYEILRVTVMHNWPQVWR